MRRQGFCGIEQCVRARTYNSSKSPGTLVPFIQSRSSSPSDGSRPGPVRRSTASCGGVTHTMLSRLVVRSNTTLSYGSINQMLATALVGRRSSRSDHFTRSFT